MEAKIQFALLVTGLAAGLISGRLWIPAARKLKTGKFDIYLGDRFKKDDSEPRMGGAVIFLSLVISCFAALAFMKAESSQAAAMGCVCAFLGIMLTVGLLEDHGKDTRTNIGIKPLYRFLIKLTACIGLVLGLKLAGYSCGEVLLPFRWGYIHLGILEVPLNALLMTGLITAVEIHDCHSGYHETGIDGLCVLSVMTASLGLSAGFAAGGKILPQLVCLCLAVSCGAFEVYSISPSKIYPGQSGGLVLGGALCSIMVLSGLQLAVVFAMTAIIADALCAALQRAAFAKTKKLLFKGASLHEHLRAKGFGDYGVMGLFGMTQLLGSAAAIAFIIYENKLAL